MKKPIRREVSEKEYERPKFVIKVIGEKHFCPICDKPCVEHFEEYFENGEIDTGESDFSEEYFAVSNGSYLEISFIPYEEYMGFEPTIELTPEEIGLDSEKYEAKIKKEIENYYKSFNIKNYDELIFCSEKCAKKFLIENIFQEKSNNTKDKRV